MILLVNVCKEKMHVLEFVKPVEDVLKKNKVKYFIKNFDQISAKDLGKAKGVIICGTSLKDDFYLKNLKKFRWVFDFEKPVLGICAGMQIIGLLYNGKLAKLNEIGFFNETFQKEFLGMIGEKEVYHLHNNCVQVSDDFMEFTSSKINQAIKHKEKEIYGVLFHPEVRNKDLIINFTNNCEKIKKKRK